MSSQAVAALYSSKCAPCHTKPALELNVSSEGSSTMCRAGFSSTSAKNETLLPRSNGRFYKPGVLLASFLAIRALLYGDYIRALMFRNSHMKARSGISANCRMPCTLCEKKWRLTSLRKTIRARITTGSFDYCM